MSLVLDLLIAALAIVGALGFLVSALALLRVRDALSMVNSLGPATGVGVPLLLAAALLHQGRTEGWDLMKSMTEESARRRHVADLAALGDVLAAGGA
jgi:multisubunit Na+/H+ antiporter MnhG subunit